MLHDLARRLVARLAETKTVLTEDDFRRLATAGEPVRRACALLEAIPADVAGLLAAYEAMLLATCAPLTSPSWCADALARAEELAALRGDDDEDGNAALSLVLELEASVAVIAAAERAGCMARGTTVALATQLEQQLVGVSERSPHLAQSAEDRWLTIGDDPVLAGAYGWLDVLAEAAPSRRWLAAVVRASARHERRVDEALHILARKGSVDGCRE
jgi:hypothetical protein